MAVSHPIPMTVKPVSATRNPRVTMAPTPRNYVARPSPETARYRGRVEKGTLAASLRTEPHHFRVGAPMTRLNTIALVTAVVVLGLAAHANPALAQTPPSRGGLYIPAGVVPDGAGLPAYEPTRRSVSPTSAGAAFARVSLEVVAGGASAFAGGALMVGSVLFCNAVLPPRAFFDLGASLPCAMPLMFVAMAALEVLPPLLVAGVSRALGRDVSAWLTYVGHVVAQIPAFAMLVGGFSETHHFPPTPAAAALLFTGAAILPGIGMAIATELASVTPAGLVGPELSRVRPNRIVGSVAPFLQWDARVGTSIVGVSWTM